MRTLWMAWLALGVSAVQAGASMYPLEAEVAS